MPDSISIIDILKRSGSEPDSDNVGSTARRNIDKTGYCYHVITKAWGNDNIFTSEAAKYRHSLLCKLCSDRNVTIVFSVTMPNHTHDVFFTPDWETLAEIIRLLNSQVSRFIKKEMAKRGRRISENTKIFEDYPSYVIVRDIKYLFFLGKYLFDNPAYLKEEGRIVPYSCFWMFEKSYFRDPYDKTLYKKLFGMEPPELLEFYQTKTKAEVKAFADMHFQNWTEKENRKLFVNANRLNR